MVPPRGEMIRRHRRNYAQTILGDPRVQQFIRGAGRYLFNQHLLPRLSGQKPWFPSFGSRAKPSNESVGMARGAHGTFRGYVRKKRKFRKMRPFKKLKKQVRKIARIQAMDLPKHILRTFTSFNVSSALNQCKFQVVTGAGLTVFHAAYSTEPSVDVLSASATISSYAANTNRLNPFLIKYHKQTCIIKNNDLSAAWLEVCPFVITKSSSDSFEDTYQEQITGTGTTAAYSTSLLQSPLDFPTLRKWVKFGKRDMVYLKPGDIYKITSVRRNFIYDPYIIANDGYSMRKGDQACYIRFHGDIAHDETDPALVGYATCVLDCVRYQSANHARLGGTATMHRVESEFTDAVSTAKGVNIEYPQEVTL
jgi:hypothetical protein